MKAYYKQNTVSGFSYGYIERKGSKQWFKDNPQAMRMLPKTWQKELDFMKHHPMSADNKKV